MPSTPTSIFISYSRRDSYFVDQLVAELKARRFLTRVDYRRIETSQSWKKSLQSVLDKSDVLLVILSPTSVTCPQVQMEYRYVLMQRKPVLLLEYQPSSELPKDLDDLQMIDFKTDKQHGLRQLMISLSRVEIDSSAKQQQTNNLWKSSRTIALSADFQPVELDIGDLYKESVVAFKQGNLELSTAFLQAVVEREPYFGNGILAPKMAELLQKLRVEHISYFREQARKAHQVYNRLREAIGLWQALLELDSGDSEARQWLDYDLFELGMNANVRGEWELAMSAWEALLKLNPDHAHATGQLRLAQDNQGYAQYYNDAQQLIEEKKFSYASTQLRRLWQYAPYYGDPEGLTQKIGVTKPLRSTLTLYEEKEEVEQVKRKEEERVRREHIEWEMQERARLERERQLDEAQKARELARSRSPGWFIQYELNAKRFVVWCSLFFILCGLGTTIGIVTQSRSWALATILITVLLAYVLGYYRTIHRLPERLQYLVKQPLPNAQNEDKHLDSIISYAIAPFAIIVLSSLIVFYLVNSTAFLKYNAQQMSHVLWFTRSWWLGRQVNAGLIIGCVVTLITFFLTLRSDSKHDLRSALVSGVAGGILVGFICWLICASVAFLFDWGWGFGNGWYIGLLGFAVGILCGAGLGGSLVICRKGKPLFLAPLFKTHL